MGFDCIRSNRITLNLFKAYMPNQCRLILAVDLLSLISNIFFVLYFQLYLTKSRKENPQKLTQLSPRFHPRHLVGKRTAQKDTIKDITSDSQVYSYFPYRWSAASLTISIFNQFLYLYITTITINNSTPHLKSLNSKNRRAALERPAIKLLGGGGFS